jgi:hypothetical protein
MNKERTRRRGKGQHLALQHRNVRLQPFPPRLQRLRLPGRGLGVLHRLREGRGVSDEYGVRDAACPISTG